MYSDKGSFLRFFFLLLSYFFFQQHLVLVFCSWLLCQLNHPLLHICHLSNLNDFCLIFLHTIFDIVMIRSIHFSIAPFRYDYMHIKELHFPHFLSIQNALLRFVYDFLWCYWDFVCLCGICMCPCPAPHLIYAIHAISYSFPRLLHHIQFVICMYGHVCAPLSLSLSFCFECTPRFRWFQYVAQN